MKPERDEPAKPPAASIKSDSSSSSSKVQNANKPTSNGLSSSSANPHPFSAESLLTSSSSSSLKSFKSSSSTSSSTSSSSSNTNATSSQLGDLDSALHAAQSLLSQNQSYSGILSYLSALNKTSPAVPTPSSLKNQLNAALLMSQSSGAAGQNPLLNQLLLPLMLSQTAAAAASPIVASNLSPCVSPMLAMQTNPAANVEPTNTTAVANLNMSNNSNDDDNDFNSDFNSSSALNNRRRRTRITEDQLKVLRQYFDINKSPSDEQITDIAQRTQLQAKVIKHWFRNTLFKERQKDKDSPYNFNNPPVTQLNLEEYEKTGKIVSASTVLQPVLAENNEPEAKLVDLNETSSSSSDSNKNELSIVKEDDDGNEQDALNQSMGSNLESRQQQQQQQSTSDSHSQRPNRTKFSDTQIRALNQMFKQQRYPKDEQVARLAKQLRLKQRVITVWFQNARQKIRKNGAHGLSSSDEQEGNNNNEEEYDEDNENNEYYDDDYDDNLSSTDSASSVSKKQSVEQSTSEQKGSEEQAAAVQQAKALQLALQFFAAQQASQFKPEQLSAVMSAFVGSSTAVSLGNDIIHDEMKKLDNNRIG